MSKVKKNICKIKKKSILTGQSLLSSWHVFCTDCPIENLILFFASSLEIKTPVDQKIG